MVASAAFEEYAGGGRWSEYCELKVASGAGKVWEVVGCIQGPDARAKLVKYLGYDQKRVEALAAEPVEGKGKGPAKEVRGRARPTTRGPERTTTRCFLPPETFRLPLLVVC